MGTRVCIFCGGAPRTREHVPPRWALDVLAAMEPPGDQGWEAVYEAGGLVESDRSYPMGGRPEVVVNAVCGTCNSGWMAEMEGRVRTILTPMIQGRQTPIAQEQQIEIACWASKTAMVLEFHERDTVIGTVEERARMASLRIPPDHHRVRLAARPTNEGGFRYTTLVAASDTRRGDVPDMFSSVIVLGHLAVHIWGGPGYPAASALTDVSTSTPTAVIIWPPTPRVVVWPPPEPMDESSPRAFVEEIFPWVSDSPELADWRDGR